MASRKTPRKSNSKSLAQFGLFEIPDDFSNIGQDLDDDDNDSDLEAELAALTVSNKPKIVSRKKPKPEPNLDAMVADSLRDIPSDDDESVDENDPDLLNELSMLNSGDEEEEEASPVENKASINQSSTNSINIINDRIKMYEAAEKNAQQNGETSKLRRLQRGLKTLKDLLKQAQSNKPINLEELPPEVSVSSHPPKQETKAEEPIAEESSHSEPVVTPSVPQSPPPELQQQHEDDQNKKQETLNMLNKRKNEYKLAALHAKKAGDKVKALELMKISKQFEMVVEAVEKGAQVDLSDMPPSPQDLKDVSSLIVNPNNEISNITNPSSIKEENTLESKPDESQSTNNAAPVEEKLITASSMSEALDQRLAKYKSEEEKAKGEGNSSKARRMARIIKQYEQAIKLNKAGKPVPIDELPTPPGYAPLPGAAPPKPATAPVAISPEKSTLDSKPAVSKPTATIRTSGNQSTTTLNQQQLAQLLEKQKEYKLSALKAKKNGDLEAAKEYLRTAKGFDKLIEASKCGLPVNMSSLPISVSQRSHLEEEFDEVSAEQCVENDDTTEDILTRLESQLEKQLKLCLSTRDHHRAIGDVATTNRFEQLGVSVSRDMDLIRAKKRGKNCSAIKFHYEMKHFSVVRTNTDLTDCELELKIIRGINYKCDNPSDIDTYVKFIFPHPQEEPYNDRTSVVKNTNNPEYNEQFKIPIDRKSRTCVRAFKKHMKFEIYSKSGLFSFFKSDTIIGQCSVKLEQLLSKIELHDSFDILDGRKSTGGKLEVQLRVRDPLSAKQIEEINEKWLIIDS